MAALMFSVSESEYPRTRIAKNAGGEKISAHVVFGARRLSSKFLRSTAASCEPPVAFRIGACMTISDERPLVTATRTRICSDFFYAPARGASERYMIVIGSTPLCESDLLQKVRDACTRALWVSASAIEARGGRSCTRAVCVRRVRPMSRVRRAA